METQMESRPRADMSRTNAQSRNDYEAQPGVASSIPIEVTRLKVEPLTDEQRHGLIAVAAYYLAGSRNFEPGHKIEDWLAAELEVGSQGVEVS